MRTATLCLMAFAVYVAADQAQIYSVPDPVPLLPRDMEASKRAAPTTPEAYKRAEPTSLDFHKRAEVTHANGKRHAEPTPQVQKREEVANPITHLKRNAEPTPGFMEEPPVTGHYRREADPIPGGTVVADDPRTRNRHHKRSDIRPTPHVGKRYAQKVFNSLTTTDFSSFITTPTIVYPALTISNTSTSATPTCPPAGSADRHGRYSCNPAHQYSAGQICDSIDGCYFLHQPGTATTVTAVVSALTTYCSSSTVFTHQQTIYTVMKATTLVLPCAGGCTVSTSILPKYTPVLSVSKYTTLNHVNTTTYSALPAGTTSASSAILPGSSASSLSSSIVQYTGAANKVMATGLPVAAAAVAVLFV